MHDTFVMSPFSSALPAHVIMVLTTRALKCTFKGVATIYAKTDLRPHMGLFYSSSDGFLVIHIQSNSNESIYSTKKS